MNDTELRAIVTNKWREETKRWARQAGYEGAPAEDLLAALLALDEMERERDAARRIAVGICKRIVGINHEDHTAGVNRKLLKEMAFQMLDMAVVPGAEGDLRILELMERMGDFR